MEAVALVESHEPCELTLVYAAGPIALHPCGLTPHIVPAQLMKDVVLVAVEPVHGFRFPDALAHILTSPVVIDQVLLVEVVATLEGIVEVVSAYGRLEESFALSRIICMVGIRRVFAADTWLITSDENPSITALLLEAEVDDLLQGAVIRGQQL